MISGGVRGDAAMIRFKAFMMVVLLLVAQAVYAGDEPLIISAPSQFQYAKDLFQKGDYISAMVEFKRYIHFFPGETQVDEAHFFTGMSWYHGGRFQEALQVFEEIMTAQEVGPFAVEACFMAVKCHEKNGNPSLGEIQLLNLIRSTDDPKVKDRAYFTLSCLHMETGSWTRAGGSLQQISEEGRTDFHVPEIMEQLEKNGSIPRKNPKLAGALAVVPGAGFLYCGRFRDAFVSFLVNGGLIYSAVRSFDRGDYALGGVVSFVGFGFYAGNIYGSVSSAHKYNREADKRFLRDLKQKVPVTLGVMVDPDLGSGLSLRWEF